MNAHTRCVILFALLVCVHPIRALDEQENRMFNLLKPVAALRQFWTRYLSAKHRSVPEFSPEQRKFQQVALETHNILRAHHCAQPLELDDEINVRAQAYAEVLASNDSRLIHSTDRKGHFGENLYAVTRSTPITVIDGMTKLTDAFEPELNVSLVLLRLLLLADKVTRTWYTEISLYNYNKPGYSRNTGHFTQIVWNGTKKLGIGYAFAREGRKMYVAAQYGPPGNYGWSFAENVHAPTC